MAKPPARFNDEEIGTALTAVALASGNTRRASRELAGIGIRVDQKTLHRWINGPHAERYAHTYKELLPSIGERTAKRFEQMAEAQLETQELTNEELRQHYKKIPARDLPGAVRNLATAAAINTDKSQLLRGQPTQIVQKQDAAALIRKLQAGGVFRPGTVEGTAEEDPPASLPPAA